MHSWNGRIHISRLILAIPCGLACWGYICNQTEQIWEPSWAGDDTHRHTDKTGSGKPSMWYSLGLSYELIYHQLQYTIKNTNFFSCSLHFPDKTLRLWKDSCCCHGTNHPWCTDFLQFINLSWWHHLWMDMTGLYTYMGVSSGSQSVGNQVCVLKEIKTSTSFISFAGTRSLGLTEGSRSRSWGGVIISTSFSSSSLLHELGWSTKPCFSTMGKTPLPVETKI